METADEDAGGGIPSPADETCQAFSIQPVSHACKNKQDFQKVLKAIYSCNYFLK